AGQQSPHRRPAQPHPGRGNSLHPPQKPVAGWTGCLLPRNRSGEMTFEARQPIARRHLARHYLSTGLCLLLAIVGRCQGKKQSALDQPQTPKTTKPAEKGSESTSVV